MSIKKYTNNAWVSIPYKKYGTEADTITTLPKTIIADGTNATATIKGNLSQSGTPTPSSPIYPTETGDKTANLYSFPYTLTFSLSGSGDNRTVTNTQYIRSNIIQLKPNTTYYFSGERANADDNYGRIALFTDMPEVGSVSTHFYSFRDNGSTIFTTNATENYALVYLAQPNDYETNYKMMLAESSTPVAYEPYGMYKIPILSGGTTTPVYLGEAETTRKIKKFVITGEERNLFKNSADDPNSYLFYANISLTGYDLAKENTSGYCSHLETISGTPTNTTGFSVRYTGRALYFNLGADIMNAQSSGNTLNGFREYCRSEYQAGHPITVWYVLATPTTGIVNEPIRKIGDYADSVSVTGIPTTGTAESFDIDTTLKPSEVDLTYHGWHEHSDTKFTE